ncbi:hypothetical protein NDU88_001618 [Pleurodeles waltl]|uniref:AB hydrolase-1 domain-containing protein n=1 Tax=Pleurodeles waltl TaxID=8319 RepID=A0AAV7MK81_PLEWA|nr:hypothetical protein NDU88_001618 [Pleurodeles waltl]
MTRPRHSSRVSQSESGGEMKRRDVRGSLPPREGQEGRERREERRAAALGPVGRSRSSRLLSTTTKIAMFLLALYVVIPFIVRLFPVVIAKCIFLNMLKIPFFVDLQHPELLLNNTTNLYLTPEDGISVGVWHTVPASRGNEAHSQSQDWFEASLADDNPAVIYLHGNAGTRAAGHRIQLMKVLSASGFHVLALDYRGYGDSTGEPSEEGLTFDAMHLYEWVKARKKISPVCIWGHSLGTGVATNVARLLEGKGRPADAVILESPFTNIRDAVAHNLFAKLYRFFPGFEYFILETPALNNITFRNDENVKILSSPLLILHAEDDHIVPVELGKKLFKIAQASRSSKDNVKLFLFPALMGYRHNNIHKEPRLPNITRDFVKSIKI